MLTLITGDRITLEATADGRHTVTIDAAERDDQEPIFEAIEGRPDVWVAV